MELNKREKAYLSLYKGDENAIDVLLPNVDEELRLLYAVDYNYKQVNTFINFILTKNPSLFIFSVYIFVINHVAKSGQNG